MPTQYKYKAITVDGSRRSGTMTINETTVEEFLREQELLPVKISPIEEKRPLTLFGFLRGADYEKLIMFTSALSTLHRAGIPLLRALTIPSSGSATRTAVSTMPSTGSRPICTRASRFPKR